MDLWQWSLPSMQAYWRREANDVARRAALLQAAEPAERAQALGVIRATILGHTSMLPADDLARVANQAADELYATVAKLRIWQPGWTVYLNATVGVLFEQLARRGYALRFTVMDPFANTPAGAEHQRLLVEPWFAAAGVTHICPHAASPPERDASKDQARAAMEAARAAAAEQVLGCLGLRRHFLYVDADPGASPAWGRIWAARAVPGTLPVYALVNHEHYYHHAAASADGLTWAHNGVYSAAASGLPPPLFGI